MSVCVACHDPLLIEVDHSDDESDMGGSSHGKAAARAPETVPDDVHLNCGCHFHWQCLLEAYTHTQCPSCEADLTSAGPHGGPQVLCTLRNEGGLQEGLDILPLLTEESYLKAYPEDRKARAFLEFCREGDVHAILTMLYGTDEEDSEDEDEEDEDAAMTGDGRQPKRTPDELLRYQDPIGEMQSGLHAAVQGGSREVAWLLLLLASSLDYAAFPAQVFQEAESLGVMRPDQTGLVDIRSLRDADGKTAEDLAREMGGVWTGWPGTGRLAI